MYEQTCLFNKNITCPLYYEHAGQKVDGLLCSACVDMIAMQRMKSSTVALLLTTYQNEKKAREIYETIKKCTKEWV